MNKKYNAICGRLNFLKDDLASEEKYLQKNLDALENAMRDVKASRRRVSELKETIEKEELELKNLEYYND